MTISGLMEMLNFAALYPVMNNGLNLENNNFVLIFFNNITRHFTTDNYFFASCIVLITITVIAVAFKFIYQFISNMLMTKIVGDTQKIIFRKLVTADYDFFVKNQQGKLIHTSTIAPQDASNLVLFIIRLVYDVIIFLFLFSLLLVLAWQGTLLLVVIGFGYALFIKKVMGNVIYKCATIVAREDRKKNVILNELISGIRAIKIFFTCNSWQKKYINAVDSSLHNRFKMLMARVFPQSFMKFALFIIIAVLGIFLSHKPQQDLISVLPLFGTFVMVATRFFPSIQDIGNDLMVITKSIPNTKIIHALCTAELKTIEEGEKILGKFNKRITFENVWFKYENAQEYLLKGVTFEVNKKEITAVVGPSGAGKTTIINLLLGLYRAAAGEIKIDSVNIFDYTNRSYLAKIGYVSQETFIFNGTIEENIRFGMENCTHEMIIEAARQANAHEFIMRSNNGYDTVVGDAGIKLSGGQRQRIAIARAMLRKPEIMVLDEATSSLDNIAEKNVQGAINRISQHTTVLVIAHRLSTIQNADKIIILENGVIKEQGTHNDLLHSKGLYARLNDIQNSVRD